MMAFYSHILRCVLYIHVSNFFICIGSSPWPNSSIGLGLNGFKTGSCVEVDNEHVASPVPAWVD